MHSCTTKVLPLRARRRELIRTTRPDAGVRAGVGVGVGSASAHLGSVLALRRLTAAVVANALATVVRFPLMSWSADALMRWSAGASSIPGG
ncbi:hypothetical protein [Streptacidiphilus monticola]|uniref:Uncharacterized protein n=1 Tax=Streptacidiphilus monticola TaxID=2161674 RepID=A0ABW1G1U0_9ACTN